MGLMNERDYIRAMFLIDKIIECLDTVAKRLGEPTFAEIYPDYKKGDWSSVQHIIDDLERAA